MDTVAILGGGQLGMMLGHAARDMGVSVRFLDPSADACAVTVGPLVIGALDDEAAVLEVGFGADVVTFEWEGVPAWSARVLVDTEHLVRPSPTALAISQDRLLEKQLARELGIGTASFAAVDIERTNGAVTIDDAVSQIGVPSILKTRRGGYDGKGQRTLAAAQDARPAADALGGRGLILESLVAFDREVSIIAARDSAGDVVTWPVVENHHRDGILRTTIAPAPALDRGLQTRADEIAGAVLEHFDYVGVLTIELFQVGGDLLVNELAPRVHNSGHWTIEGAATSQFENHMRAVTDRPLGPTNVLGPSAMVNCIGVLPDPDAIRSVPGAVLHDYGKEPRRGRKVGHVTVVADSEDARDAAVERLSALLPSDG